MNKIVNFLTLYIVIFLIEIILVGLILLDSSKIDFFNIRRAWLGSAQWNFWRVLFYGVPSIVFYFLKPHEEIKKTISKENKEVRLKDFQFPEFSDSSFIFSYTS